MEVRKVILYLAVGPSNDEPERLFTLDRSPGMHQVLDANEEELQLTAEDTIFLHQLKICAV